MREGFYYFMTFQDRLEMESINDAAGQVSQAIINKVGKQYLESAQFKQFINNHEDLVTFVLTVLMTPQAEPKPAMGHHKPTGEVAEKMMDEQKIMFPDGQKDDQGNSVCLDHSAMLVPSDDMKKYVYNQALFGGKPESFQKFGKHNIKKGGDS